MKKEKSANNLDLENSTSVSPPQQNGQRVSGTPQQETELTRKNGQVNDIMKTVDETQRETSTNNEINTISQSSKKCKSEVEKEDTTEEMSKQNKNGVLKMKTPSEENTVSNTDYTATEFTRLGNGSTSIDVGHVSPRTVQSVPSSIDNFTHEGVNV